MSLRGERPVLTSVVALALAGCVATGNGVQAVGRPDARPRQTRPGEPVGVSAPGSRPAPGAATPAGGQALASPAPAPPSDGLPATGQARRGLAGTIMLPAGLLANNGASVISDQGGSLVSDQGGALITDNGAGLITDNGAGLITDNGAGVLANGGARMAALDRGGRPGAYRLRQASQANPGLVAIANAQVALFYADGQPVRDEQGRPQTTMSDAAGRYAFPGSPGDRAVVVICQLAGTAGQAGAIVPRGSAPGTAGEIGLASSVMASYVISRYARTQADPQGALERLPADLAGQVLRATANTLVAGTEPKQLRGSAAVAALEALRARAARLDSLYDDVRRAMVVAGQANLGEGEAALTARMVDLAAVRRGPTGTWMLLDRRAGRLWEVVEGRLKVVFGSGAYGAMPPDPGSRALDANLGDQVQEFRRDALGRTLLVGRFHLDRVKVDGTIERLWLERPRGDEEEGLAEGELGIWPDHVDAFPLTGDQVVLVRRDRVISLGGAPTYNFAPATRANPYEIKAAHATPDGTLRLVTERIRYVPSGGHELERRQLWRLRPGQPAEALATPDDPVFYGFDDGGALVTSDVSGAVGFHPAAGGTPTRLSEAVTRAWPRWARPPQGADATGWISMSDLRFGGDAGGRWVSDSGHLAALDAAGTASMIVGAETAPAEPGGVTALKSPAFAVEAPDGALVVLDAGVRQVLRVVDRRGTVLAGQAVEAGAAEYSWHGNEGDPFGYSWYPGGIETADFGATYARPAAKAVFASPTVVRAAADGAVWVLDMDSVLRRIQDGRLTTAATRNHTGPDACWFDFYPTGADTAVVLARRGAELRLLEVAGTRPPVELARVPADPEEADSGSARDCLARLPDGSWLVRAHRVLWRCQAGAAPVRIGANFTAATDYYARMTADGSGKVAASTGDAIFRVDVATGEATAIAGAGAQQLAGDTPDNGLMGVCGLATAANGDLLVTDREARQVKRIPAAAW